MSCELKPQIPTLNELRNGHTQRASELSPEAEIRPELLHGTKPAQWEVTTEEPWHRIAAHLFATGSTSCRQVASILEVHEKTVQNLLRQKWFQERVTRLIVENGGKDIMTLFKAEQFNSLVVYIQMRDDPKTPHVVRKSICQDIFDRTLGKPIATVITADAPTSDDPVGEARRLREELNRG